MEIIVNGERVDIKASVISGVLDEMGICTADRGSAIVEHNFFILKQEKWNETAVNEGDNIEILKLMGGG